MDAELKERAEVFKYAYPAKREQEEGTYKRAMVEQYEKLLLDHSGNGLGSYRNAGSGMSSSNNLIGNKEEM